MAREIQNLIDSYNRLDPAFTFMPEITMQEITTTACLSVSRQFKVEVEVMYNTKNDLTPRLP